MDQEKNLNYVRFLPKRHLLYWHVIGIVIKKCYIYILKKEIRLYFIWRLLSQSELTSY